MHNYSTVKRNGKQNISYPCSLRNIKMIASEGLTVQQGNQTSCRNSQSSPAKQKLQEIYILHTHTHAHTRSHSLSYWCICVNLFIYHLSFWLSIYVYSLFLSVHLLRERERFILRNCLLWSGKSGTCWACQGSLDAALSSQTFLLGPSADLMRPTYVMESNLLYSIYWLKC